MGGRGRQGRGEEGGEDRSGQEEERRAEGRRGAERGGDRRASRGTGPPPPPGVCRSRAQRLPATVAGALTVICIGALGSAAGARDPGDGEAEQPQGAAVRCLFGNSRGRPATTETARRRVGQGGDHLFGAAVRGRNATCTRRGQRPTLRGTARGLARRLQRPSERDKTVQRVAFLRDGLAHPGSDCVRLCAPARASARCVPWGFIVHAANIDYPPARRH